jgi:hypothetical protein
MHKYTTKRLGRRLKSKAWSAAGTDTPLTPDPRMKHTCGYTEAEVVEDLHLGSVGVRKHL